MTQIVYCAMLIEWDNWENVTLLSITTNRKRDIQDKECANVLPFTSVYSWLQIMKLHDFRVNF